MPDHLPLVEVPWNTRLPLNFTRTRVNPIDDPREPIFKRFNTIYKTFRDYFGSIKPPFSATVVYGRVDVADGRDHNNLNHPRVFAVMIPEDRLTRWTDIDGRIQGELRKAFNEEILLPIRYHCREVQAGFASSKSRSDREFNNLRKELATRTRESGETHHKSAARVSRLRTTRMTGIWSQGLVIVCLMKLNML